MNDLAPLRQLQSKIGYAFQDLSLLKRALTHRSFGQANNERLEFLGDSILGAVIGHHLFNQFVEAPEGQLTRLRSSLVKGETLAQLSREFDLGNYLILGEGELKSGGSQRDSILADALESIIGAIYLEVGYDACFKLVIDWFQTRLQNLEMDEPLKDPKTALQEFLQGRGLPLPSYSIEKTEGQAHDQLITIACVVAGCDQVFNATARSKKQAEKSAASLALKYLQESSV